MMKRTVLLASVLAALATTGCDKAAEATQTLKDKTQEARQAVADAGTAAREKADQIEQSAKQGTQFVASATALLKETGTSLASITDEASAEAALPRLREIIGKFGELQTLLTEMAPAIRATIQESLRPLIAGLREASGPVLALPVVGEKLKPTLEDLFARLDQIVPPAAPAE